MSWRDSGTNRGADDGSKGPHWVVILLVLLFLGAVCWAFVWSGGGGNQ